MSNLRQIGLAIQMYTDDYDGWFPSRRSPPQYPARLLHFGGYLKADKGIWECPSTNFKTDPWKALLDGHNLQLGYELYFGYYDVAEARRTTHISWPCKTGIVGDMIGGSSIQTMYYYGVGYLGTGAWYIDQRHNGGFNILFVDGHVKWFPDKASYYSARAPLNWYKLYSE